MPVSPRNKSRRDSLRVLKRGGKIAYELWKDFRSSIRQCKWSPAEEAAALADLYEDMEIVFGRKVMKEAERRIREEEGKGGTGCQGTGG